MASKHFLGWESIVANAILVGNRDTGIFKESSGENAQNSVSNETITALKGLNFSILTTLCTYSW